MGNAGGISQLVQLIVLVTAVNGFCPTILEVGCNGSFALCAIVKAQTSDINDPLQYTMVVLALDVT